MVQQKVKRAQVKWDDEEKNKLAEHVAKMRMTDIASSLTMLLNDAQSHVLPEGRRRNLATYKLIGGFEKLVKIHIERMSTRIDTLPDEPEDVLSSMSIGNLVDVMLERLSIKLQGGVRVTMDSVNVIPKKEELHIETGAPAKREKGVIIGVAGLYLANFRALENRLKDENVRLRYFDTDTKPMKVPSVEYMVCVPNKLPHVWQDFARSTYKDKAYIVRGRLREAEKVVREIVTSGRSTLHY